MSAPATSPSATVTTACAHANITKNKAAFAGRGFVAKANSVKGLYLLSGVASCGVCGAPLHARRRGRNERLVYVCSSRYVRGKSTCSNTTGVPAADLHRAVARAMRDTFSPEVLRAHLDSLSSDEGTAQRASERAALIAKLPELARRQERLAKAVTKALVLDDEVLMGEVRAQYEEAKGAAQKAQERLAELEGVERDLREQRGAIEAAGVAMASWVDLLGRADVESEHLDAARKFLGAVLVGPLAVKPVGFGWTFDGRSRLDGGMAGVLIPKVGAIVIGAKPVDGEHKVKVTAEADCRCAACVRPISGGSDAPVVVNGLQGPEMAPHTPHATRPGKPVALRERRSL